METLDFAQNVGELYRKCLETLLASDLKPEDIGEAAAGLKLLSELLSYERENREMILNAMEEVKIQIIAEVSAWFKGEIDRLLVNLSARINEKLSHIPDTENLVREMRFKTLVGGGL